MTLNRTPTKQQEEDPKQMEVESERSVRKKYSVACGVPKLGQTFKLEEIEEDEKCGGCKKEVRGNQNGISCDACGVWYHCGCIKVSQEEYRMIQKMANRITWTCGRCGVDIKKQNELLKSENQKLMKEIDEMKKIIHEIDGKVEKIGEDMKEKIIKEVKKEVIEELAEEEEKKIKKRNLVIYKVEESKKDLGKEREREDVEFCKSLFINGVGVENFEIEKTVRLGKTEENRNRPLLVILKDKESKYEILNNAKKLKRNENVKFQSTYITPDLTRKERENRKKLMDEIMRRRQAGEEGWYIKKGELVRGSINRAEGFTRRDVDDVSIDQRFQNQTENRN